MIRIAIVAVLLLGACGESPTPPETPLQPTVETPPAPTADPTALAADELAPAAGEITVTLPAGGAEVTSPVIVEGAALNDWYFEGVFQAELAVDGEVIIHAPAQQQAPDNWTNPGPVRFKAELPFTVTTETPAVLILREDMPKPLSADSDVAGPARTVRIPVTLVP
jgi:hypothetical protein